MDRRCCCEKSCLIGEDNFNRDSLGDDWAVINGEPYLQDGRLFLPPEAHVQYKKPSGLRAGRCDVRLCDIAAGASYGVCPRNLDGTGSFVASWAFKDEGSGLLEQLLLPGETSEWFPVSPGTPCQEERASAIWTQRDNYSMTNSNGEQGITCCHNGEKGRYVGLMNLGTTLISFDDFRWWRHDEELPGCPETDCSCLNKCIPASLTATFTGGCAALEGWSIPLSEEPLVGLKADSHWKGSGNCPKDGLATPLDFVCGAAHGMKSFILKAFDAGGPTAWFEHLECQYLDTSGCPNNEDESSCDPLLIRFGPFRSSSSDCECCDEEWPSECPSFYIDITE